MKKTCNNYSTDTLRRGCDPALGPGLSSLAICVGGGLSEYLFGNLEFLVNERVAHLNFTIQSDFSKVCVVAVGHGLGRYNYLFFFGRENYVNYFVRQTEQDDGARRHLPLFKVY